MSRKLAPLSGVLFFVSLVASIVLDGNEPEGGKVTGVKVIVFFTMHRDRMIASAALIGIAVFSGVIFYGFLRDYLRRNETVSGLARTAFGGALLYAGGGCLGAGIALALTDSPSHLSPGAAQGLDLIRSDVNESFIGAGTAILLFCYGLAIVKSGMLPRWLGWVTFPFVVIALIPELYWAASFAAGIWTLILSLVLLVREARSSALPTSETNG